MTDRKLENRILYIVLLVLMVVVFILISVMPISLKDLVVENERLDSFATFFGALLGAIISGATALGIMLYQANMNKKEERFRSYGSIKYMAIKLVTYPELQRITMAILDIIQNPPSQGRPGWEKEFLSKLPINEFDKLVLMLKQEREKVPYEFVSRYFTVVNQLEYLIGSLESLRESNFEKSIETLLRQKKIETVLSHLEFGEDITRRFRDNLFEFILQIEKKYDIKDAY